MEPETSLGSSSSSSPPENLVDSFIGNFVALICKDDKRYEGIVSHLNLHESSLGLQNVICYGREGKPGLQLLYEVNDHMIFRGSDIKDIQVLSLLAPPKPESLLGHVVSLITTEEVRCEGLITHVNVHDSLIFLKNVVCYGTEGRERRGRLRFAPCNQLAGPIHFQIRDIKDLEIIFIHLELSVEERQEIARGTSEFPPLSRSHIGHQQLHETVGSETYVIGGQNTPSSSADVWVYNRLIGKRKAPSMMVARKNPLTCSLDGKLYVLGGCEPDESMLWAEVFDPKTQTWEALPDPGVELRYSLVKKLQAKQGKIYVRSNKKNFVYLTKESRWEEADPNLGECMCEIENVCYRYGNKRYWWYDTKCEEWKKVKGLSQLYGLHRPTPDIELGNYGGKLVVFWDRVVSSRICATKEIWCAMISLEKSSDEVCGHIKWIDAVLIAPWSYTLSHCVDSLQ
ncbi:putative F-box/kelch-repeat protein At4g19330 [Capsella rubella]|uniref:putative F-box/kelch-repeat protein At4g19330 n=1 Tax=Capsella rubella TaxID=81985 RepID=UPI000CD5810C|nr:putative F-box/kelch-repeat protein At4g19330 [Capsella rubella]